MSGSNYTLNCPKCKTLNPVRGKAMTLAMTCSNCNIYFRQGRWNKELTTFAAKHQQALPLGSKGIIDGIRYEVMGFTVKMETKYKYNWREYLVFNPYKGYAFLSEYNGHWNFVWPIEDDPKHGSIDSDFEFNNKHFQLFQKYRSEVIYANGEFFFDVVDITASTINQEYICPPYLLAVEESEDSLLWCEGEYLTPKEVSAAFKIPLNQLPSKTGIGYTQPLESGVSEKSLITFSILILLLVVALQFMFSSNATEKVVYEGRFQKENLNDQKLFVTPSFTLDGGTKSVDIYIQSPLQNDWFFGEFSLINEDTGTEYNFTKDIEYYSGYEGGESWTEGSTTAEAFISQIPGGQYHLNIYPEFSFSSHEFFIQVRRDVPTLSNFWVTLIVLALFPAGFLARKRYLEGRRWSESDYSPYSSE
jgi:Domain of unknown function (DUF4178)